MAELLFPIAISSQLDVTGEEKIHACKYVGSVRYDYTGSTPVDGTSMSKYVYELEKGWSFDGYYIPHYVELNWYFGDDPITYRSIQKVRVHGLSKGRASLQVSSNGVQTDYISDYSSPQYIDLPPRNTFVTSDFYPVTNYADMANRGLAIQLKIEGRNTDITLPEPPHVLQVLVVQSSPQGTGSSAN